MSDSDVVIRLPTAAPVRPLIAVMRRFALALFLVAVNWLIVVVERDGYTDNADGKVSATDALYYTTVTLTTTGYGDITPVTDSARLVNALVVTPMRLLFVILLVGTTIQALTDRSRQQFRLARWRSRLKDHVVVLGYGTKGRNAVRALLLKAHSRDRIVVVDSSPDAVGAAAAAGLVAVTGAATDKEVLREAMIDRARTVIVALGRDDTAVLATLTVKRLSPHATVVAVAQESESASLLSQSGATSVIVSAETAGRLLGLATDSPETVCVVEDLLSFGHGLDLVSRDVTAEEIGSAPGDIASPVLAVIRAGRTLNYDDPAVASLLAGDRIIHAST